jgi:hypothetical protein
VGAAYPQLAEGRPDLFISLIFSCSANDNALLIRQVLEIRKQCLSMIPRSCLELNSKVMVDVFINCRFERIFNSGRGVSKRSVGSAFSDASEDAEEPLKKIADLESLDGVR